MLICCTKQATKHNEIAVDSFLINIGLQQQKLILILLIVINCQKLISIVCNAYSRLPFSFTS